MTDQPAAPGFTARETQFEATVRVRRDQLPAVTVAALVAEGHCPELAEAAVRKVFEGQIAERRKVGLQNMGIGALCAILGVGISVWMSLSSRNSFVLLWGLVVVVVLQFGYGLLQFSEARPQANPTGAGSTDAV